jgi:hypothetical protein
MTLLRPLALAFAACVLNAAASAEVHIVELEGAAGLNTMQEAVDLALDGDTIVVRDRRYFFEYAPGFVVDGKGLTIVGVPTNSSGENAEVIFAEVRNLAEGQTVTLRNFTLSPRNDSTQSALRVEDSAGAVRIENCKITGSSRTFPLPAIAAEGALDLTFVDCEIYGALSSAAVDVSHSRIALYRSTLAGSDGIPSASYMLSEAGDGYLGLHLRNRSFAWIGKSTVQGGTGGFADCIHNSMCTALGGDGGTGLWIEPYSYCVALDSDLLPGEGGYAWPSAMGGGTPGQPGTAVIGHVQTVAGSHRDLNAPLSALSESLVPLRLHGVPGERVTLFMGDAGDFRFLGPLVGAQFVGDFIGVPAEVGVVPPSGVLEIEVPMPVTAIDAARTIHVQAVFRTSPTRFRLSPPRMISVMGGATPFLERPDVVHVSSTATGDGYGRTWQHAAGTLHRALTTLPNGGKRTEVWLKAGTYTPAPAANPTVRGPLRPVGSFALLGGFAGTETTEEQRDPVLHASVLSGDLMGDDHLPGGSRTENSYQLLDIPRGFVETRCLISGVTLTGTEGNSALEFEGDQLDVDRCHFHDNSSHHGGASVFYRSFEGARTLNIRNSRFHRNSGSVAGAITATGSAPGGHVKLEGCEFIGNSASDAYLVFPFGSTVQSGGVLTSPSLTITLDIESCTMLDNDEETTSGAVCSFGGLFVREGSAVTVENSIIWSHRITSGLESVFSMIDTVGPSPSQSNCLHWLPPNWNSSSNLIAPPGFQEAIGPDGVWASGDEDLRLAGGSLCIDAGASALVPASLPLDLDGNTRIVDDPSAPNVGSGGLRIVDMGAYERQAP